ncbi:YciI family protein [Paracidovorax citrulli]
MKYLCLIYYQEKEVYGMSPQDWNTLVSDCVSYGDRIRGSGHFISGQPLEPVETAKTVRVRDGKVAVTDGPFAETKEQLAGFYLLEAADLNEAVQVASHIPPARLGSIEIRPVRELPEMAQAAEASAGRPADLPTIV